MARTTLKEQIVNRSKKPQVVEEPDRFDSSNFVSSGSTLLNLALTDNPNCGWQKGKMANIIGDSSSGKTFLTLTAFAEAQQNKAFSNYNFIFDDAEEANEFDMGYLFGDKVHKRVNSPKYDNESDEPINSNTMEDFHDNLLSNIEKIPSIYVLDSFDSLTTEADDDKLEEQRQARAKGKEVKGSYGMTKARKSSEILRHVVGKLKKSESILLIISQTRDNIDPMSFEKKTRSGGKALKFYASHEIWLANGGAIKSKDREIGVNCIIRVKKNKITGKRRTIEFPIYYDYGVDDISSCVSFLIKENYWKKQKGATKVETNGDLGLEPASEKKLVELIEEKGLEKKLKQVVARHGMGLRNL